MTHKCPANGCTVDCPQEILMCKKHWFMVSKNLRDQVWSAWRKVKAFPNDNGIYKTYLKIRGEAIDHVNKRLTA